MQNLHGVGGWGIVTGCVATELHVGRWGLSLSFWYFELSRIRSLYSLHIEKMWRWIRWMVDQRLMVVDRA